MAILDSEKIDFLWKRIIWGTSKTANATTKLGSNETIPSPLPVLPNSIWRDANGIPAAPPATDTAYVKRYVGAQRLVMVQDTSSPQYKTWLACMTPGHPETRLTDLIPPTFGVGYAAKVYVGDPQSGGTRIFPDTTGEEFVFDYEAGVLTFPNNYSSERAGGLVPGDITLMGLYIEVYQYVGGKGLTAQYVPFIPQTLGQLADVEDATGTPPQGAFLRYIDGVWQADVYQVSVPTPVVRLSGLQDVDMHTGLANGDVLVFRNGFWVPEPQQGGGGGVQPSDLGTMAYQDADAVNITGGAITGVIIDGGTF